MNRDLFVRSKANPIIKPSDLPFNVNGIYNPGVALVDGEVVLLLRIENRRGISALHVARSANGVDGWRIERKALLEPRLAEYPYERWGCEDPRVTQVGPHTWMIAYTAYSPYGPGVALARMQGRVIVQALTTRLPDFRLVPGNAREVDLRALRGFERMEAEFMALSR